MARAFKRQPGDEATKGERTCPVQTEPWRTEAWPVTEYPRGTEARRAAHTFQSHTCKHIVEKHGPGQRHSSYTQSPNKCSRSSCYMPGKCVGISTGFRSPPCSARLEACGGHVWVVLIIWEDAPGTELARQPGTLGDLQCPEQSHSIKDCPLHTQRRNLMLSQGHSHEDAKWPLFS